MLKKDKPLGVILYQGPSLIDGSPIVVIAVGFNGSRNAKTGGMVQTYIIRADESPVAAIKSGNDYGICGNCPHRGDPLALVPRKRTCYVNISQGPLVVYKSFIAGKYIAVDTLSNDDYAELFGRMVRFGTYGDPAAAPVAVWRNIARVAQGWTGYTHQWRMSIASGLRPYVMASADTEADMIQAHRLGWRTFRVAMPSDNPKTAAEIICPASAEAGKKLTCDTCKHCNGTATNRKSSVVIQAHGGFSIMAAVKRAGTFAAQ